MKVTIFNSISELTSGLNPEHSHEQNPELGSALSPTNWQDLTPSNSPFEQHEFYQALENSGSVSKQTGWQPQYITLSAERLAQAKSSNETSNALSSTPVAIIPSFLKSHSWGEYVFDWDWAQAYERNNLDYYPKLVVSIPFTPVPSHKVIAPQQIITRNDTFALLSQYCTQHNVHSWHWLFTHDTTEPVKNSHLNEQEELPNDVYLRYSVQFHWFNLLGRSDNQIDEVNGYNSFDHYLETFTARKRKNTKKERTSIAQQGVTIKQFKGNDIDNDTLNFFYLCYQLTYLKRNHQPHLSQQFFNEIVQTMPDNILLIVAYREDKPIASAFFFYDDTHLYGRYWGCTEQVNNLHFELCYYQGIDFCIANNLQCFNPGTQGEHKIQRGFQPVLLTSYHWLKAPYFKEAIAAFCQRERDHMKTYFQQCQQALPFKKADT